MQAELKVQQARAGARLKVDQATAEVDLQILRARQTAAVDKSRSDTFLQAEQEERGCVLQITNNEQSL